MFLPKLPKGLMQVTSDTTKGGKQYRRQDFISILSRGDPWIVTMECNKDDAGTSYYCLCLTNDHEEGKLNVK